MSPDTGIGGGSTTGGTNGSNATGGTRPASPSPSPGNDWAKVLTAKVETVVSLIRDRTVTPVLRAVRFVIFGLIALSIGTVLAVVFAVLAVRVLDDYVFHSRVWASYLVLAGIFAVAGLLLSRMRHPRT
ncbi:MAG: hypothetical protein ABSD78_06495 [Acidimicrobiales bacterium]|jgi:hypothetical protein